MYWQVKSYPLKICSCQKLWQKSNVSGANPSLFVIFVVHEWVTTEDGVCWTSLCSYSFFFPFFFLLWLRAKLAREVPQNRWLSVIGPYKDWQLIFWGENCMTAAKGTGTFLLKKTKRFVISSPGSFRHRWKWAEMTLGSRLKKKNNSKKLYWPSERSIWQDIDPMANLRSTKKTYTQTIFFSGLNPQWLYFTVVSSVSLRYIIKKRKLLPQKGSSENTSAKCAHEKLVNGEINLFHSGYST